jgi:aspartyl/asparaginyl beta-hydroxylase (cupin superfamily)
MKYIVGGIIIVVIFIIIIILSNIPGYILLHHVNYIYKNCATENKEYYPTNLDWCKELRDNYLDIKNEYVNYITKHKLKRFKEIDKVQTNYDISEIPWEVLFLRVYNKDTSKIKYFPKTYSLISKIPGCSLAMFSVLHPGKIIPPHEGPYKGVLRYHLALITPKDHTKCEILVNQIPYNWKEGSDVLFDDTFLHSVKNESNETRVVLFLDVKKEFNNIFLDSLNSTVLYFSQFHETVNNIITNTDKDTNN